MPCSKEAGTINYETIACFSHSSSERYPHQLTEDVFIASTPSRCTGHAFARRRRSRRASTRRPEVLSR
ncbi:hypothetical protein E4U40_007620 [Claviceps sp. LM458 group G5]|nr:hypothetical protein E4U40_007620 [Claviceps sp. LM458 group G5]